MKYKLLNEVLIEWNKSSKQDSDNTFLKSEDIKGSLDKCFIYKLDKKEQIKIFDTDWPEFEKYRDKVWINGKHVELDNSGQTVDEFARGEYKVYIEDIDKVINTDSMFYGHEQLVSAFIPNSVAKIDEFAFYYCSGLARVAIPNSVISIDRNAFTGCSNLTSVKIPNSVTTIGYRAFESCIRLTSVTIPDTVTHIGNYAFSWCAALPSMTIGNSVTTIGTGAFWECTALTSVTIPNSVTSIGDYAFYGCNNLKTVYVEDINKFKQIQFEGGTADPRCYGAKLIELKK